VITSVTYLDRHTGEVLGWQKMGDGHRFERDLAPRTAEPLIIEFDWGYVASGPITVDVEFEPGHAWTAYVGPRRDGAE
jgi:hypothetical protein